MLYQVGYFKKVQQNSKTFLVGRIHIAGLEPINFTASFGRGIYTFYHSVKDKEGKEVFKAKFAKLWRKKTDNKYYHASGRAFIAGQILNLIMLIPREIDPNNPYDYAIFVGIPNTSYKKKATKSEENQEEQINDELPDENEDIPF